MSAMTFQGGRRRGDFKSKGPELLVDLAENIATALVELFGTDAEQAAQAGREIAERMAQHWGGQNLYFPKGLSLQLSERDMAIYADFTGHNHSDLVRKYGVSLQWIYKIVKAMKAADLAERQPCLPGMEP